MLSEGFGQMAENLVFMELKRRGKEIYYWKDQKQREVDFVVKDGLKISSLIQVCWNVGDKVTKKREISGLTAAMDTFKLHKGIVITEDYAGEETVNGLRIAYIPLWKWLLFDGL